MVDVMSATGKASQSRFIGSQSDAHLRRTGVRGIPLFRKKRERMGRPSLENGVGEVGR